MSKAFSKPSAFMLLMPLLIIIGCDNVPPQSVQNSTYYIDLNGTTRDLKDTQGKWLVINYWAQWCKPCLTEIPELNRLAQRPNTLVVAVNYDGISGDALLAQAKAANIQFPLIHQDPSQALAIEYPQVLPTTFIFNPQGQLHKTLLGPQTFASLTDILK